MMITIKTPVFGGMSGDAIAVSPEWLGPADLSALAAMNRSYWARSRCYPFRAR